MFDFEDPVGVRLVENASGTLTGRGCAVDAPDASSPGGSTLQPDGPSLCGDIIGAVAGDRATFGFTFWEGSGSYSTEVTISNDLQRMTGFFDNGSGVGDGSFRVSWLRVPPDQWWLQRPSSFDDPLDGGYELTLTGADAGARAAGEYLAEKVYLLSYRRQVIRGDLGAF